MTVLRADIHLLKVWMRMLNARYALRNSALHMVFINFLSCPVFYQMSRFWENWNASFLFKTYSVVLVTNTTELKYTYFIINNTIELKYILLSLTILNWNIFYCH
jgi:hypothetical protein